MKADMPSAIVMFCCSVLQKEVETLLQDLESHPVCRFPSSMLHMRPRQLGTHLETLVDKERARGHRVVLVYGECCGTMAALEAQSGVVRTPCCNCCDLILGHEAYRRFLREGAFFLFPEWTHHWRKVFSREMGLTHENATCLMHDMHSKLIYLDTGVIPVPHAEIQACAQYCGLPYEVHPVALARLATTLRETLGRLDLVKGRL